MKNFKKYVSFGVVIFFLVVLVVFLVKNGNLGSRAPKGELGSQVSDIKFVKIAGQLIKVELATTSEMRARGLSGRISLAEDEGMLFIFQKSQKNYFWMKDMNFPIDIVWLDDSFRVIYIKKDALPSSYPKSFGPGVDNSYVLEVSSHFSEKNNLKIGDVVEFLR